MITINYKSMRIPVLVMGKGWLAVDKPAGLTVHNDPGRDLLSITIDYIQKKSRIFKQICIDPDFGIQPVHRLDRETSGVLLLAGDRETFRFFSKQFETRSVTKRYMAIVHGPMDLAGKNEDWQLWQWPLAKEAGGRKNPAGSGHKQPCKTRYRMLDHSVHYTMVEIELLTGRKHQIRRHAKMAKHPVAGDTRYGSDRAVKFLKKNCAFDRLGLHAYRLTIQMPGGDKPITIKTIKLPDDMRMLFDGDRSHSNIIQHLDF